MEIQQLLFLILIDINTVVLDCQDFVTNSTKNEEKNRLNKIWVVNLVFQLVFLLLCRLTDPSSGASTPDLDPFSPVDRKKALRGFTFVPDIQEIRVRSDHTLIWVSEICWWFGNVRLEYISMWRRNVNSNQLVDKFYSICANTIIVLLLPHILSSSFFSRSFFNSNYFCTRVVVTIYIYLNVWLD